jgi:hypothetical protein
MNKLIVTLQNLKLVVIVVIASLTCMSCDKLTNIADEIATGPSTISVKMNGIVHTYEATGGRDINGVYTSGNSGNDKISIHLYTTQNGLYMWSGSPITSNGVGTSEAQFNDAVALKNQGELRIIENDLNCVYGTFNFKALNPITKDTIYFTEGSFKIRYTVEED